MKVVKVTLQAAGKGPRLIGDQKALLSIEESIFLVRSMNGFTRKYLKKAEVIAEMLATIAQDMLDEEEKD